MMPEERPSRPAEASGAAQGVGVEATGQGYPTGVSVGPLIRSVWRIDLSRGDARQVEYAPAGGHVVLVAPRGRYPDNSEIAWICDHGRHVGSITVDSSDLSVVAAWHSALRYSMHARGQVAS